MRASASIEAAGKENARRRRRLSRASEQGASYHHYLPKMGEEESERANDSKFLFSRRSLDPDSVGRDPIRSLESASVLFHFSAFLNSFPRNNDVTATPRSPTPFLDAATQTGWNKSRHTGLFKRIWSKVAVKHWIVIT